MRYLQTLHRLAKELGGDRRGNIAIATAILMPVILLAAFGGVNVTWMLSRRQELTNIAQIACNRAVKPLRMKILDDSERTRQAIAAFDTLAADRKFDIRQRNLTSGWLTAQVTATAFIPTLLEDKLGAGVTTSVTADCEGVPPFPKKDDVILTSYFKRPDGNVLPMKYGAWGIYKAEEFGWQHGEGPGVEIQDWIRNKDFGKLPAGSQSPFVVELDSDNGSHTAGNTSMYKTVELHKGTYRFSFWYYGRQPVAETNIIKVSLEGVRPVSPKVLKLEAKGVASEGWQYKSFDIPVAEYSLYKLWIEAGGTDDSVGGNFNDLKLEYIKRPGEV